MFRAAGYVLFLLDDDGWPIPFHMEQVRKNRDILAMAPSTLERMKRKDGPWRDAFCAALERALKG
jgi:hypothetical protein